MKKLLMTAAAVSALAASPALAAAPNAVYDVTGSVAVKCSVAATGTIAFGELADANGDLDAADKSADDTTGFCNGAGTTVEISHTDLTNTETAATGFTSTVSFTPVVTTDDVTLTGDKLAGTAIGAFSGLTVAATSLSATDKLMAGDYDGTISITLTPSL